MPELYITKAHPNPAGKDRPPTGPIPNDKLNEEWVEFQNVAKDDHELQGVNLSNYTFDVECKNRGEANLTAFQGISAR